jgi:hypothetical protein
MSSRCSSTRAVRWWTARYADDHFIAGCATTTWPPSGRTGAQPARTRCKCRPPSRPTPRRRVRRPTLLSDPYGNRQRERHTAAGRIRKRRRARFRRIRRGQRIEREQRGGPRRAAQRADLRPPSPEQTRANRTTSADVRPRHRVRLAVNLVNGSTLAGLAAAGPGGPGWPRPGRAAHRRRLPAAGAARPAFTLGNVIITAGTMAGRRQRLFRHEAQARYPVRLVRRPGHAAALLHRGGRVLAAVRRLRRLERLRARWPGLADGGYTDTRCGRCASGQAATQIRSSSSPRPASRRC